MLLFARMQGMGVLSPSHVANDVQRGHNLMVTVVNAAWGPKDQAISLSVENRALLNRTQSTPSVYIQCSLSWLEFMLITLSLITALHLFRISTKLNCSSY